MTHPIHRNNHRERGIMGRQRNIFQAKEQDKTPEKGLNETETSDLLDKEFKQNLIMMLTDIGRRLDEHSELDNRELENITKNPSEMKNTIPEMKNSLEGLNSRVDDRQERISEQDKRLEEIT